MCKNPRSFSGDERINGLANWIKEMESDLESHKYANDFWFKFNTCTFMGVALTWWNTQVKNLGVDAAYVISWEELKK